MNLTVQQGIEKEKLIAILRGLPDAKVLPLMEALVRGGIRVLEFTFDHAADGYMDSTLSKVALVKREFGSSLTLGCGTVLTAGEADAAISAGAQLIISPHTDPKLIAHTKGKGAVSIPGAFTPTEIVLAFSAGADFVKLFPAGELGLGYIKAIRAPLAHIPLLAVGGVAPENVRDFLKAGVKGFGVGSQLVENEALKANDYDRITKRALAYTRAIAAWEAEA